MPATSPALLAALVAIAQLICPIVAEESPIKEPPAPKAEEIKAAVAKSLPLLENATRVSMRERSRCFTCHNQALPVMALTTAAARGFAIDRANLDAQVKFTADFLAKNRDNYLQGRGQGGQTDTAGYALWTLAMGGWKPDATTSAVTEYFLLYQKDLEHWKPPSRRPPTENSPFTSSHVALRALKTFGTPEQKERITRRTGQVREWLLNAPTTETEDNVSRLWALSVAGAEPHQIGNAAQALFHTQRADGGWSQLPNAESDAYATATALVALHRAADLPVTERTYVNGLRYLLSKQLPDGS